MGTKVERTRAMALAERAIVLAQGDSVIGSEWVIISTGQDQVPHRLTSRLDYITETNASSWSLGWMAAASYVHPLTDDLGVCAELKCMNTSATHNTVFSAQVQLQWKFLRW
ncbi:MAG: hypothetical protein ABI432_08935 [Flavobacteriales bacterium]